MTIEDVKRCFEDTFPDIQPVVSYTRPFGPGELLIKFKNNRVLYFHLNEDGNWSLSERPVNRGAV